MALTSFADTDSLSAADRKTLLDAARQSIASGLSGARLTIDVQYYPAALQVPRATFVTLHVRGELRGCIGSLEPRRPLIEDVVDNAYAAAFRDTRFAALTAADLDHLSVHLSLLSPLAPMRFESEDDLLRQLRPGVDGLVLAEHHHRGTFLPAVWESLPTPREFLRRLKEKAGLPPDYWSDTITVERYTVESLA
ncbi:MAG: AmmeMemoRadiSam system protein A [Gammaproteobacteria bacterium]